MTTRRPERRVRIGVAGLHLEANRWAPVTRLGDFEARMYLEGDALAAFMADVEVFGFAERMAERRDAELVPLLLTQAPPGGPVDHADFHVLLDRLRRRLRDAAPLDGVFIFAHGAGATTACDDMDGAYFELVREEVGPRAPIVVELDLHANVSPRALRAVDAALAFRTNPHLDVSARSRDAADLLDRLLNGEPVHMAAVRVPLATPQISQLTATGEPLAELFEMARTTPVADVSLLPGFALADVAHGGFTVIALSFTHAEEARTAAKSLAREVWARRDRFKRPLTSIERAVALSKAASADRPIILADVADNPGGGGGADTNGILRALVEAGVAGACVALVHDPGVVQDARAAGEGSRFQARFNQRRAKSSPADPYDHPARVLRLAFGSFRNARGAYAGYPVDLGPACVLDLAGNQVCVTSRREQIFSDSYLEHLGVDPHGVAVFVLKSRGHFRAGFDHLVPSERVYEVEAPGLTTPNLRALPWSRLRDAYPMVDHLAWAPTPLDLARRSYAGA